MNDKIKFYDLFNKYEKEIQAYMIDTFNFHTNDITYLTITLENLKRCKIKEKDYYLLIYLNLKNKLDDMQDLYKYALKTNNKQTIAYCEKEINNLKNMKNLNYIETYGQIIKEEPTSNTKYPIYLLTYDELFNSCINKKAIEEFGELKTLGFILYEYVVCASIHKNNIDFNQDNRQRLNIEELVY